MTLPRPQPGRPWYREPWPWALLAAPATAVVAGVATLLIALAHQDGLVAEDYYRQGLAINQRLEREQRAAALRLRAQVLFSERRARVLLEGDGSLPGRLRLRFVHPTRSGNDREVVLERVAPRMYEAALPAFRSGRWLVQLEDPDRTWRLSGVWAGDEPALVLSSIGERVQQRGR
ncbi:MAG TPA: FixH family protein [Burkholderiales bacterium]|nr:FixH family protein [Burkholderiales bacterium]